jgi:hypothetical protein
MSEHMSNRQAIRVITLYDKINLDGEKIHDGVSIILTMDHSKLISYINTSGTHSCLHDLSMMSNVAGCLIRSA